MAKDDLTEHTPQNLAEAIESALKEQPLATGTFANVHRFTVPELKDYVLRVSNKLSPGMLRTVFKHTSHLTPPKSLPSGIAFGQFLLVSEADIENPVIAIMRHVPGQSMQKWMEKHLDALPSLIVQNFLRTQKNPFEGLFEDAYRAAYSGFGLDSNDGNIMYHPDSSTMQFIDQRALSDKTVSRTQALKIAEDFSEVMKDGFVSARHKDKAMAMQCVHLIDEAMNSVRTRHEGLERIAFVKVNTVRGVPIDRKIKPVLKTLDALVVQTVGR